MRSMSRFMRLLTVPVYVGVAKMTPSAAFIRSISGRRSSLFGQNFSPRDWHV